MHEVQVDEQQVVADRVVVQIFSAIVRAVICEKLPDVSERNRVSEATRSARRWRKIFNADTGIYAAARIQRRVGSGRGRRS